MGEKSQRREGETERTGFYYVRITDGGLAISLLFTKSMKQPDDQPCSLSLAVEWV